MDKLTAPHKAHKDRPVVKSPQNTDIDIKSITAYDHDVSKRKRVVGYCRVSTEQQAEHGVSLDAQKQLIRNYCNQNNLDLIDIYVDGQSGKNLDRPGFKKVIATLETGKIYGLVIAKLDRLSRSIVDICKLVDSYFSNQKYALLSASENIDTKSSSGRMYVYIMSVMAQIERENIVERTIQGMRQFKAQGGKVGRLPYGWYYSDKLDSHGRRVIEENPKEQAAIRRTLALHDEGKNRKEICSILNTEGYRAQNEKGWSDSIISGILVRNNRITQKPVNQKAQKKIDIEIATKRALELHAQGKNYSESARTLNRENLLSSSGRRWSPASLADLIDVATTRDRKTAYGLAHQLRSDGKTLRDIGRELLAEGFKPARGSFWHAASVYYLLKTRAA